MQTPSPSGGCSDEVNQSHCDSSRWDALGVGHLPELFFFHSAPLTPATRAASGCQRLPALAVWHFNIYARSAGGADLGNERSPFRGTTGALLFLFFFSLALAPSPQTHDGFQGSARRHFGSPARARPDDVIAGPGVMSLAGQVADARSQRCVARKMTSHDSKNGGAVFCQQFRAGV